MRVRESGIPKLNGNNIVCIHKHTDLIYELKSEFCLMMINLIFRVRCVIILYSNLHGIYLFHLK